MIRYSYFEEKDAEEVAELMVRSSFWMGKYDPSLTGRDLIRYQREKGFCFGVVGRQEERCVTYVGAYRLGSQRVAGRTQVIMSGLIIDEAYRSAVFSLADMFQLILARVRAAGCREMIAEVGKTNYLSLFMMKKTGFVVLDREPTVYGEIILKNYLPSILNCVWGTGGPDAGALLQGMQKIDRRELLKPVEWIDDRQIVTSWKAGKDQYEFIVDTETGEVTGIRLIGSFRFRCVQDLELEYLEEADPGGQDALIRITCRSEGGTASREGYLRSGFRMRVPEQAVLVEMRYPGCPYTFRLTQLQKRKKPKERIHREAFFDVSLDTGYTYFGSWQSPSLVELWPCAGPPYLESLLEPNHEKKLRVREGEGLRRLELLEENQGNAIRRTFFHDRNRMAVQTEVYGSTSAERMLFHFGILEKEFEVTVHLKNGVIRRYCQEDTGKVFPELIFEDFRKDEYAGEEMKGFEVIFRHAVYQVTCTLRCACLVNRNYIRILPLEELCRERPFRIQVTECQDLRL